MNLLALVSLTGIVLFSCGRPQSESHTGLREISKTEEKKSVEGLIIKEASYDGLYFSIVVNGFNEFISASMESGLTGKALKSLDLSLRADGFSRKLWSSNKIEIKKIHEQHRYRSVEFTLRYDKGNKVYFVKVEGFYNITSEVELPHADANLVGVPTLSGRDLTVLTEVKVRNFNTGGFTVSSKVTRPMGPTTD